MAEGSETPGGGQGRGPEGGGRRGEGDLFSERRARRAAESGELALMRRAEAAEATVHTLERHVSSLQQRLRELEDERVRTDELLSAERKAAREREHELQRVKQREYAEQQLRLEAEDRASQLTAAGARLDEQSREEIERLDARLQASEEDARELTRQLESVQRRLAETSAQAAEAARAQAMEAARAQAVETARAQAAELTRAHTADLARETPAQAAVLAAERELQRRLDSLERRVEEIQRGLEDERARRERSEALLENMREGHRRMEQLLGDMKGIVARVTGALAEREQPATPAQPAARSSQPPAVCQRPLSSVPSETQGAEMADALAVAVERLRARAEAAPDIPAEAAPDVPVEAPDSSTQAAPGVSSESAQAAPAVPPHKHTMTLLGRIRLRRKQRRGN